MTHRTARGRLGLIGAAATAFAVLAAVVTAEASAVGLSPAAPSSTQAAWTGTFDNFHTSGWNSSWGLTSDSQQCAGASGSFTCNWGYSNMQSVPDSSAPGRGQALKVTYPANSGPPSCTLTVSGCVLGGGQFYQDLTKNGQNALAQSPSLDLKYYYKFPVGFDFGRKSAGKMPGLWGGGVPGCESGGQHCAQGWSTRYMWRGGSSSAPNGEVYFYTAAGSGFGADLCLGKWTFPADGTWHSIEQLVNVQTGSITVWSDGRNVCQQTESLPGAFSGVFFSTFHGGHDTSWSPSKTTSDEFADFTLSTDGPQTTGSPSPSPTASASNSPSSSPSSSPSTSPSASASTSPTCAPTSSGGGGPASTVALAATVTKTKDWGSGYTDQVTVGNDSGADVSGWNVQLDLDPSMNIESFLGADLVGSGSHETFSNTTANGAIANGSSVTFTFSGDYGSQGYLAPANVTASGQSSGPSPSPSPSGCPSPSQSPSSSATPSASSSPTPSTSPSTSPSPSASPSGSPSSGPGQFQQSLIDTAVAAPLFAWAAATSSVPRPGTNPANIGEAKVLYYLALVDKLDPAAASSGGTSVDGALLAQVRNLIAGGNEPDADGGLEMWGQAPVAQALLLVKNGPAWHELTSAEQNRVDLLEAAMGYGSNYTYNDANNYSSGICGFGNFSKTNNPNYRDGGVDTEIAAIQYFGASAWDSMLTGFSDSAFAAQLNSAGLTNAGGCFSKVGSAGDSGIAKPFVYQGHHSSDLMGIWGVLAGDTFDKTARSVVSPAHIADSSTSPYEGMCCMGHEFDSTDSQGLRSSALYTFEGWMNVTGSRVAMTVLGNFNPSAAGTEAQYHIGTLDLKYKLDHGYISHALNQSDILVDDHGNPAADGPNVKGFLYDWDAYSVAGNPQS